MADPAARTEEDIFAAIRAGDLETIRALVTAEHDLARARRGGASAVLIAVYRHQPAVAALLRQRLGEIDIFEAAALGELDSVRRLLDLRPDLVNAVAVDGFGPLGLACFFDHEPVARLLPERGARADAASDNGMGVMPLHSAVAARSVLISRQLRQRGAAVNARQGNATDGFTPLMEAAMNGQAEMVDLLLEHGADRTLRDDAGLTAEAHARLRRHTALADRLG